MRKTALAVAGLGLAALAGCTTTADRVGTALTPVVAYTPIRVPAVPPPYPIELGRENVSLDLWRPTAEAIPFVREIAEKCWVPFLQAKGVAVDTAGGVPVVAVTGATSMPDLVVNFMPSLGLAKIVMTGPALRDPAKMQQLLRFLTRAEVTNQVDCRRQPA